VSLESDKTSATETRRLAAIMFTDMVDFSRQMGADEARPLQLLAAVYSELDRDAEARAESAEVLRINPSWSLEVWKQRTPYKDPATLERVFVALRKAGLK
jgi:hypothetical protein